MTPSYSNVNGLVHFLKTFTNFFSGRLETFLKIRQNFNQNLRKFWTKVLNKFYSNLAQLLLKFGSTFTQIWLNFYSNLAQLLLIISSTFFQNFLKTFLKFPEHRFTTNFFECKTSKCGVLGARYDILTAITFVTRHIIRLELGQNSLTRT